MVRGVQRWRGKSYIIDLFLQRTTLYRMLAATKAWTTAEVDDADSNEMPTRFYDIVCVFEEKNLGDRVHDSLACSRPDFGSSSPTR